MEKMAKNMHILKKKEQKHSWILKTATEIYKNNKK